jgi:hypothetical protein
LVAIQRNTGSRAVKAAFATTNEIMVTSWHVEEEVY